MEDPPSSSFAQSSALFSGLSKDEIEKSIYFQFPVSDRNNLVESSNRSVAISATGELQDFKYDDFREAYRMMNGPSKYPFQSIAQISNYKFDPYYFDGSESDPNINVNENLIGTPLGKSLLEDPRLAYVKNLLTLKEYQGQADQLNDSYIKELYMVNSEKGANYYQNMLDRQKESLDYWSREGRKRKQSDIPGIAFTMNLPAGDYNRQKKKVRVSQTLYSTTPNVQRNYRRELMDRIDATRGDPNDIVNYRNGDDDTNTIVSDWSGGTEFSGTGRLSGMTGLISGIVPPPNSRGQSITLGSAIIPTPRTPLQSLRDENISLTSTLSSRSVDPAMVPISNSPLSIPQDIGEGDIFQRSVDPTLEKIQTPNKVRKFINPHFSDQERLKEKLKKIRQRRADDALLARLDAEYSGAFNTPFNSNSPNVFESNNTMTFTTGGNIKTTPGRSRHTATPNNMNNVFDEMDQIMSSPGLKPSPGNFSTRSDRSVISRSEKEDWILTRETLLNTKEPKIRNRVKFMEKEFAQYGFLLQGVPKEAGTQLEKVWNRRNREDLTGDSVRRFQTFLNDLP